MKTIILAWWKWTRLMPLTKNKPKPMVEVLWKPILEYILETIIPFSNDVTIITKYKEEVIKDYFKDNFKWIDITYHTQVDKKWTWAALIWIDIEEDFVVLNWDTIYNKKDLEKIYNFEEYACLVKEVKEPSKYGIFQKDENNYAIKIIEKPDQYIWNLANMWVYKFPSKILKIIEKIKPSPRWEYEITDAINLLLKDEKIKLIKQNWSFIDIWYPEDIEKAEKLLQENI